ncbi:hypothetical protein [Actinocorallia libanotica]|uniref:SH3 domain-containing protein n=1 Tax=Actinocorallia libanotica TaxID=46162 RepID=A0ABP4B587_9ACTN
MTKRKTVAAAAAAGMLAGTAFALSPPASARAADGVIGRAAGDPSVNIRRAPEGEIIGTAPLNKRFRTLCWTAGAGSHTGWGGTNKLWDKVADLDTGAEIGYIADVWLDTGADVTGQVPECGSRNAPDSAPVETPPPPAAPPPAPETVGTGARACVFVASVGASRLGHVGWAVRDPGSGDWLYGSTDSVGGSGFIPPGHDNGSWYRTTTSEAEVRKGFKRHDRNYDGYRCINGSVGTFPVAKAQAQFNIRAGYWVLGNNCLDHTLSILRAYGETRIPPAQMTVLPNVWIDTLLLWEPKNRP